MGSTRQGDAGPVEMTTPASSSQMNTDREGDSRVGTDGQR